MELESAAEIEEKYDLPDVDVRSIDDAPLRVQGKVLTTGVLLYSRDEAFRVAYEVRTRQRYFDFQPTLERMHEVHFCTLGDRTQGKGFL